MNLNKTYNRSRGVLKGLKNVCLVNKEKLYLANSKDIVNLIYDLNLADYYPQLRIEKKPRKIQHR